MADIGTVYANNLINLLILFSIINKKNVSVFVFKNSFLNDESSRFADKIWMALSLREFFYELCDHDSRDFFSDAH